MEPSLWVVHSVLVKPGKPFQHEMGSITATLTVRYDTYRSPLWQQQGDRRHVSVLVCHYMCTCWQCHCELFLVLPFRNWTLSSMSQLSEWRGGIERYFNQQRRREQKLFSCQWPSISIMKGNGQFKCKVLHLRTYDHVWEKASVSMKYFLIDWRF